MKRLFNLCSAALALLLCLGALPARAATYVVRNLNDSGPGSLRDAIASAAHSSNDDTITFSISGTIVLQSVLSYAAVSRSSGSLLIDGTGQSITISGNNTVRVLTDEEITTSGQTLTLKALTIANGRSSDFHAVVQVVNSILQIVNCVFSGNTASGQRGVVFVSNNTNGGTGLSIANSRFSGNDVSGARSASVVVAALATTTITNSSFESNSGNAAAVTVLAAPNAPNVRLTVTGSTFTDNSNSSNVSQGAVSGGGALRSRATTTIANSTFQGNSSAGVGSAIAAEAPVTVINSTFSDHRSGAGGALAIVSGSAGSLTLRNSIVANSTGGNCSAGVLDGGGNLSDDTSCSFKEPSSLNDTPAQLGPLADNGGPTKTVMPLTGSPAIDQGVNALALDEAFAALTTEQRGSGFPRIIPTGGTVDRGAVEAPAAPPPVLNTCPAATAQVGVAYNSALGATGGTASNRFSITGSLPRSLVLNPATGALTGMLIKPGSYAFTAAVADLASPTPRSSSKACTITVAEAANRGPLIVTPTRLHYAPVPLPAVLMKQTVTLTNIGNPGSPPVKGGGTPVQLGPISVTPDPGTADGAFTLLNPCPAVLYVGQSCTIVVVGPARPAAPLSATLNIPNNAPASPQTVALSASAAP